MKAPTRSFVLGISLATNVVFLGLIGVRHWRADRIPATPAAPALAVPPLSPQGTSPQPDSTGPGKAPAPDTATPRLSPEILDQLGLPRDVVVIALIEDFHRRWDRRLADLQREYAPRQVPDRVYLELARQRDREKVLELKAALGEQGYLAWDKERVLRQLNSTGAPLSDDEAERAYRLQKEFEELHEELQMAMEDGVADRADVSTLQRRTQEALDAQLEQLFGKERLDAMRGYSDPVTDAIRAFGGLEPTPAQARAVAAIEDDYRTLEADIPRRLGESSADQAAVFAELQALHSEKERKLRVVFQAADYDSVKRQSDPTYKTLSLYARAWGLSGPQMDSVHATLQALHDHVERTRLAAQIRHTAGHQVDWNEMDKSIEAARRRAESTLQGLVGDDRLSRLRGNGLLDMR